MVPVVSSLRAAGLRPGSVTATQGLLDSAVDALMARLPGALPEVAFFVPGRVEVLGKHTDYAGGRSLLCAVEQGFCVVARRRDDARIRLADALTGEVAEPSIDSATVPAQGHWSTYPATVARRLSRNFPQARHGADLAFCSDLPPAAGMSSSSALMIAVFLTLAHINEVDALPRFQSAVGGSSSLAGYLATIENGRSYGELAGDRGVGTFGGSVWAKVRENGVDGFLRRWEDRYRAVHPDAAVRSRFFETYPGPAAVQVAGFTRSGP